MKAHKLDIDQIFTDLESNPVRNREDQQPASLQRILIDLISSVPSVPARGFPPPPKPVLLHALGIRIVSTVTQHILLDKEEYGVLKGCLPFYTGPAIVKAQIEQAIFHCEEVTVEEKKKETKKTKTKEKKS